MVGRIKLHLLSCCGCHVCCRERGWWQLLYPSAIAAVIVGLARTVYLCGPYMSVCMVISLLTTPYMQCNYQEGQADCL